MQQRSSKGNNSKGQAVVIQSPERNTEDAEENNTGIVEDIKGDEAKIRSGKHSPRNNQCFVKVN